MGRPESRLLVERILKPRGFGVIHANPRFPPMQSIQLHGPDLVLVDMAAPEVSGREMVFRIRKDPLHSDTVVVGLGHDDTGVLEKVSLVAGCTGFLHLPLDPDIFPSRLESYLKGARDPMDEGERTRFHRLFSEVLIDRLESRLESLEEKTSALERERERQKELTLQVLTSLATLLETKDPYTRGHSGLVRRYAVALGRHAGLQGEDLAILERASLMHDIGKITLDLAEIHKPGPLEPQEKERVDQHTESGYRILCPIDFLQDEAQVVQHHHTRFESYAHQPEVAPRIRRLASIITLADSFDAMTSKRSYNDPRSVDDAKAEMRRCAGTQFDPSLVEAFIAWLDDGGTAEVGQVGEQDS
jgi:response regulator RpfG family c-di-GMP phosphodiesterase